MYEYNLVYMCPLPAMKQLLLCVSSVLYVSSYTGTTAAAAAAAAGAPAAAAAAGSPPPAAAAAAGRGQAGRQQQVG